MEFTVKSAADNKVVFKGKASGPFDSADTKETVYIIDFTSVKEPGTYYIEAQSVGRSYNFKIAENVYDSAFYTVMRGMYLWRCGTAVHTTYNGVTFSHDACHTEDAYLEFVGGKGIKDGTGGWHDAGDYGKYTVNAGITAGLMLKAWEQFGGTIKRISLDIPESGGNLPDLLAEVKWETDWLLKMQADNGSVYHKITTQNFAGPVMPEKDKLRRYFVPWSSAATADFVAVISEAAKNFAPYDRALADRYIAAAEKSMAFLEANPDNHNADQTGFKTGAYDTGDTDDRLWAYAELWDATGDTRYLKELEKRADEYKVKIDTDWDWGNVKNLGMLTYLFSKRDGRNSAIVEDIKTQLIKCADSIVETDLKNPYARPLGGIYYWGCNGTVARQALVLQSANILKPDRKYTDTAADTVSHLFGRNRYCRSYVTGLGYNPPMHIHDSRSRADEIIPPWPGYLAGGGHDANGWKDDETDFTTNEIAINWNSALIYALAGFLYDGPEYTPTATASGTPPTFTPTSTPMPVGLIYDGDTKGYRVSDGSSPNNGKDVYDSNNGVKGRALNMTFAGGGTEQQKVWQMKNGRKIDDFNYIEFDIRSRTEPVDDIFFGISMGASYDKLLNIKDFTQSGEISKKWTKVRLPLETMLISGDNSISELVWLTESKKSTGIIIDNIRLIQYTPPTPTISPTHTASPFVTGTPTLTVTPTSSNTQFVTATPSATITVTGTASPTMTVTATQTPETGFKIIVDSAANNGSDNLLGGFWYTYDDKNDGGSSKIWPEAGGRFEKSSASKDGRGKAIVMKGKVTTVFQWGYLGMGTRLDRDGKPKDLTGCMGLRFWYKGDGKTYRVKLVSAAPEFKNGTGDNQYGVEFETSSEWQLFEWPLSSFVQEPYWGTKVDRDKALAMIKDIQWQTKGQPLESMELMIDGVEIYGCAEKL
jgi:endoglucanase